MGTHTGGTGYVEQRLTEKGVAIVLAQEDITLKDPMVLNACLPDSAWEDQTYRDYVPVNYAACLGGAGLSLDAIVAILPEAAREILQGRDLVPVEGFDVAGAVGSPNECLGLTLEEARTLDAALRDAGVDQDWGDWPGGRYEYAVEPGVIVIMFEPVFPHGQIGCSFCG
jgi:hypothetical protein